MHDLVTLKPFKSKIVHVIVEILFGISNILSKATSIQRISFVQHSISYIFHSSKHYMMCYLTLLLKPKKTTKNKKKLRFQNKSKLCLLKLFLCLYYLLIIFSHKIYLFATVCMHNKNRITSLSHYLSMPTIIKTTAVV